MKTNCTTKYRPVNSKTVKRYEEEEKDGKIKEEFLKKENR
jgi:hypothetical protein